MNWRFWDCRDWNYGFEIKVFKVLSLITRQQELIMTATADLASELNALTQRVTGDLLPRLVKIGSETDSLLAIIANFPSSQDLSPEQQAALDGLKAGLDSVSTQAQTDDDKVADAAA